MDLHVNLDHETLTFIWTDKLILSGGIAFTNRSEIFACVFFFFCDKMGRETYFLAFSAG